MSCSHRISTRYNLLVRVFLKCTWNAPNNCFWLSLDARRFRPLYVRVTCERCRRGHNVQESPCSKGIFIAVQNRARSHNASRNRKRSIRPVSLCAPILTQAQVQPRSMPKNQNALPFSLLLHMRLEDVPVVVVVISTMLWPFQELRQRCKSSPLVHLRTHDETST